MKNYYDKEIELVAPTMDQTEFDPNDEVSLLKGSGYDDMLISKVTGNIRYCNDWLCWGGDKNSMLELEVFVQCEFEGEILEDTVWINMKYIK